MCLVDLKWQVKKIALHALNQAIKDISDESSNSNERFVVITLYASCLFLVIINSACIIIYV